MSSWVRYSIAVYIGLLISGALARQPWHAPSEPDRVPPAVYHQDSAMPTDTVQPPAIPQPKSKQDVAV